MAYFRVKGADEYAEKVKKLSKNADKIIKRAVYDGGGVVADAVKQGLNDLQSELGQNEQALELSLIHI